MASQQSGNDFQKQAGGTEELSDLAVSQEEETTEHKRRPVSQESLTRLLRTREQIMQDRKGQPFDDSTEIVRQMREERSFCERGNASTSEQREHHSISKEALEGLLQLREQIKQNHPGQPFDDSTEIVRQMREERSQYLSEL